MAIPELPLLRHSPATATLALHISCHVDGAGAPSISSAMEQSPLVVDKVLLVNMLGAMGLR